MSPTLYLTTVEQEGKKKKKANLLANFLAEFLLEQHDEDGCLARNIVLHCICFAVFQTSLLMEGTALLVEQL